MGVHPISSVDLILSNTGEALTRWIVVSSILISRSCQTLERHSQPGCIFTHYHQWFWSCQTLYGLTFTCWMGVQVLFILVSGSVPVKHQRNTYNLDRCSHIIICGSNPVKYWRETHSLDVCSNFTHSRQWFWSFQTLEWLERPTSWTHIHPF